VAVTVAAPWVAALVAALAVALVHVTAAAAAAGTWAAAGAAAAALVLRLAPLLALAAAPRGVMLACRQLHRQQAVESFTIVVFDIACMSATAPGCNSNALAINRPACQRTAVLCYCLYTANAA
jgi:membrane protease YdiL (CAAX protease family)